MSGLTPLRQHHAAMALGFVRNAAFVILLCTMPVFASPLGSGVSSGLADTHPADLGRAYAMAWNPAMLGIDQGVQIALTPVSVRIAADQAEISPLLRHLFAPYIGQHEWTVPETNDNNFDLSVESSHRVQIGVGQRGVAMGVEAQARGTFTRDFLDFIGQRGSSDKRYDVTGSNIDWSAYISLGASSAFSIVRDRLFVGATAKALDGWSYGDVWVEGTTISAHGTDGDAQIHSITATRGQGFAFDLGLAWRMTDTVTADASWLNIGYIVWDDPVHSLIAVDRDDLDGSLKTIDVTRIGPLTWRIPETVRFGLSVEANPAVRWAFNAERTLTAGHHGETLLSVGAETIRIPLIPIRLGVRYSTATRRLIFASGIGLQLGPLTVDLGIPNISALLNGGREAGIALSTGIKF